MRPHVEGVDLTEGTTGSVGRVWFVEEDDQYDGVRVIELVRRESVVQPAGCFGLVPVL